MVESEEQFEVIGSEGEVIGLKPRSEVHAKGLRHKGVYLLLFNEKGLIFVQKRAKGKDIMPSTWDMSAAEHLQPNESFKEAALRGAREELNAKVRNLKLLGETNWEYEYMNGKKDNEMNQIFSGKMDGEIEFKDGEVEQGKWVEKQELLREMEEKPEKFTPWFLAIKGVLEKVIP